jgi:hypothetical protein
MATHLVWTWVATASDEGADGRLPAEGEMKSRFVELLARELEKSARGPISNHYPVRNRQSFSLPPLEIQRCSP